MAAFQGTERYELLRQLGQGGMGTVYAVFDRRRQRRVALKVLSDPDNGSLFRFKREFRAMADLRHPNLVRLFDLGVLPEGGFFYTMELVDGVELGAYLRRQRLEVGATVKALAETLPETTSAWVPGAGTEQAEAPPDPAEVARTLVGVVVGLRALHRTRKVHRDLKPSNVVVDSRGRPVLLDFGILRDLDREGLTGQGALGTPLYMAPEQISGEEVTPAADLYSLGCILYQLLTGTPPFTGTPTKVLLRHLRQAPERPSLRRECDSTLEALCLELLEKEPEARPDVEAVLERLLALAGPEARVEEPETLVAVKTPELIGRELELSRLEVAYARAQHQARLVLIGAESGGGKSALAQEFALTMQGRIPPWFGSCYEREHVPYKAFDAVVDAAAVELARRGSDAFRLLPPGAPALGRLFPVLREVEAFQQVDTETPMQDAQAERSRAGRAFFALLSNLSGGKPPLIIIDDLQRADSESIDALVSLARDPQAQRCLVVGTYRSEEVGPEHPLQELFQAGERVERLQLPPLDKRATEALARACSSTTLSETQLTRLVEDADGNPFLVVELARASHELAGDALPSVTQLVEGRLARVGESSRRALEAAAAAAGRAGFALLGAASQLDAAELADALDELLRVQLLREVQGAGAEDAYDLMHDRLRQAVYERVTPERRPELHRRLAEHLAGGGDAARAVEHWRLAGSAEEASRAALTAAEAAEAQLAFDRAAELYDLAAGGADCWEMALRRAGALAKAGRHREAAAAFEQAAQGAPAEQARRLALRAASERLAAGDVQGGMESLDRILRQLGTRLTRWRVILWIAVTVRIVRLMMAWWVQDLFGGKSECHERSAPDPETSYRLEVYDTTQRFLAVSRPLVGMNFSVRHALLSRCYDDPQHQGRARLGYALLLAGDIGSMASRRVHHHLTIGEALCAEANDGEGLLQAQMVRGFMAMIHGNWAAVRRAAHESEILARRAGLYGDPMLMLIQNFHIGSELFQGDLPGLVRTSKAYLEGARVRGNVWGLAWPLSMLGHGLLLQGDVAGSRALLEEALEVTPAEPITLLRVHVELQSAALLLYERRAEEGLARLDDLRRRWKEGGLVGSMLEVASYRVMRARFRLLQARLTGGQVTNCQIEAGLRRLTPAPAAIRHELCRLEAAAALLNRRPRQALRWLDRGIYLAESRGSRLGLALLRVARGRVREILGESGARFDRTRGELELEGLGAQDCFLLEVEGWRDPAPASACCPASTRKLAKVAAEPEEPVSVDIRRSEEQPSPA